MKFYATGLSWHCGDIHIMRDGTSITNKRTIHFLREHPDFGKEFYIKDKDSAIEEAPQTEKKEAVVYSTPLVEPLSVPDVELEKMYAQEQEDIRLSQLELEAKAKVERQIKIDRKTEEVKAAYARKKARNSALKKQTAKKESNNG